MWRDFLLLTVPGAGSTGGGVTPAEAVVLRDEWVSLLGRFQWDWFCTMTFRGDRIHPESADKRFRVWIEKINRAVGGRRWWKKGGGVHWVRALEMQRRGVIHYHALLGGVGSARRLTAMDEWNELAGYGRVEPVLHEQSVRGYVSKYVVKGGELDLGGGGLAPRLRSWPARCSDWDRAALSRGARLDAVREALGPDRFRDEVRALAGGGVVSDEAVQVARERLCV